MHEEIVFGSALESGFGIRENKFVPTLGINGFLDLGSIFAPHIRVIIKSESYGTRASDTGHINRNGA